jgi:photosystem II stability/assembly factor-like uncharacterized protein
MKRILTIVTIFILSYSQNYFTQGWQWIDTGYPYIIFDMSFPKGQSNVGFAVGSDQTFGGNGIILKTTDGGSSWVKISADTIPGLKAVCFISPEVGYAGGFQNFFMETTDGGNFWVKKVVAPKLWYFNNIEFWNADTGIVVSFPSSVYYTTDGGSTWSISIGLKHNVEDVCFVDANTLFLAGSDETIYKSTNGGFIWSKVYGGIALKSFLSVDFYNQNYGMVCGEDGKVMVTTDSGTNWTESNTGGNGLMQGVHIFDWQNAFVVGTNEQVFKTTDSGVTWFSDFSGVDSVALYKIKFTENNIGLICGSDGKFLMNTDYVIPVELAGFTATIEGNNNRLNWTTKTELNNSGFEILRSVNSANWEKIAFIPGFGTTTETRIYSFNDEQLKSGSYSYKLKQIDFNGSFRYSDIVNVFISIPVAYSLEQNYPNPFNPGTVIEFSLPEDVSNLKLSIYNVLGEKVAELVNTALVAGRYSYQWNASNVATGMYIYELRTDKFVSIKKMMLMK